MNLNEHPELITRPEMHYVFVERVGSFMQNAGAAWQEAPLTPQSSAGRVGHAMRKPTI